MNHRDPGHPLAGGAERTILEVGRRLVARGFSVTVLAGGWRGARASTELEGLHIRRVGTNVAPHLALPLFLNSASQPDIVIDDLAHAVPWMSEDLSKLPGVVFFRHLHARTLPGQVRWPLSALLTSIEKCYPLLYRKWSFVTESESSLDDLRALGIGHERCTVIPPGVDTHFYRPGERYPTPTLVYFGGFRRYKRPEIAIRLLKEVRISGIEASLIMIGVGPTLDSVRSLTDRLELSPHVSFAGRLTPEALAEVVRKCWVNLHFSLAEGWCYTVMEASASGVPTVAYDAPGLRSSVKQGLNGFLIKEGDFSVLTRTVLELLSAPNKLRASSRSAVAGFGWDSTADAWERLLHSRLRDGSED